MRRPQPDCSPKASGPAPAACPHISSGKTTLYLTPLFSQKSWQGFAPAILPAAAAVSSWVGGVLGYAGGGHSILLEPWKERHYTSLNHASGTPSAVNMGPGYRSPITYLSSVTVSLGSLKFYCTGYLERLSTLKWVELDADSLNP